MPVYIHQRKEWLKFNWNESIIAPLLARVRHHQGRLLGRMEGVGSKLRAEACIYTLTLELINSAAIDGEILNSDQVRSCLARRLGMEITDTVTADAHIRGIVDMILDVTQNYALPLTSERLFTWHSILFPTHKRMSVLSGLPGKKKIHLQAPDSGLLASEMTRLLDWFNGAGHLDPVLKAAIVHLWFVAAHPFEKGNGRIARAITEMQLSRADQSDQRFYSLSLQIRREGTSYHDILGKTQKEDITDWLEWFLNSLDHALVNRDETSGIVLKKARFWERHLGTSLNERQRKMLDKLLDGFEGRLTSSKWATITQSSQDTAGRDINDLVRKRILEREPGGGRSTNYKIITETTG
jgi:Fic family protein